MNYDPQKHYRRSIRLKGYDYSQSGWYFVTICTYNRAMLFGVINNAEMHLNEAGQFAKNCWFEIPNHFPIVNLDQFIIMPNHIHGIINLNNISNVKNVRAKNLSPLQSPAKTIGSIIRGFKIGVTKWVRNNSNIYTVWQRNYYDHIIRDEQELNRIRQYIKNNPGQWQDDKYYERL